MNDFAALGEIAQQRFGWKLYTAMRYLSESAEVERLHSSDPQVYPLAGRKQKRDTAWSRQVLERGEAYFANDVAGIRAAFDDADRILALGLGAVINAPVLLDGRVLGTLNFLREAGGYRREQVAEAMAIAAQAVRLLTKARTR